MQKGIFHITTLTRLNACHLLFMVMALLAFAGQTPAASNANDKLTKTNVITLNTTDTTPSPDFDGDGNIGIPDFLLFVEQFGLSRGDEGYDARYDLDGSHTIGIGDFLIFVDAFGKKVTSSSRAVTIPDAYLREALEATLGKARGAPITEAEMASLTHLDAGYWAISDLTGLEFATNLTYLDLRYSRSLHNPDRRPLDASPLAGLTNLTYLNLRGSSIRDISPLAGLTNLTYLDLTDADVLPPDLSPISSLINLTDLNLPSIRSLSLISNLTNLTNLDISSNYISDLSPISNLTKLHRVNLGNNNISDLAPLIANAGIGSGDIVNVLGNPLNIATISTHIPALRARGAVVFSDEIVVFTDPQIYNDNVFVLPVAEILHPRLWDFTIRFYEHFNDEFDFLIFLPAASRQQLRQLDPRPRFGGRFHGVKNDVRGIGTSIYSGASQWGSAGKLQGVIWLSPGSDPYAKHSGLIRGPILHELMHRWANCIVPSMSGAHWGLSSANGILGGFDITNLVDHGNGQYSVAKAATSGWAHNAKPYSPIELYLAGLIPPEEVPDLYVAEDIEGHDRGRVEYRSFFAASRIKRYTINDIIAEHGPRVPNHLQAQKDFRAAVILLVSEDFPMTQGLLERLSYDAALFSHVGEDDFHEWLNFYQATGGRATITMDGLTQLQRRAGTKMAVSPSFGTPPPPIVDFWVCRDNLLTRTQDPFRRRGTTTHE